jgi:Putative DNA-binding domain
LMRTKTLVKIEAGEANSPKFPSYERTDFGKEVGRDEINWWVFKQETSIDDLREQTQRALDAAQFLKQASATLKGNRPETYGELLNALRRFAEDRSAETAALYEYVRWLSSRDIMAPTILYTYRVWGSTRMSDRWVELNASSLEAPNPDTIRYLTEIVLGLISSRLGTLDRAYLEVGEEIWSSGHFDEESSAGITVPMGRVVRTASRIAYDECTIYFTEIRDSLRNILLDIEKFVAQRNILSSDAFWRAFVEKAIRSRTVEPQLWDFKKTLEMWMIEKGPEREGAKVAFSEDVASFANARGGVLLVGFTDQREIVGLGNSREVESRLKFANEVLAKHLEYGRPIFRFHQLALLGKDHQEKLCLLVIVAQACEVVGVSDGEGHYTYPVRRETGIKRESRDNLAMPKSHMKSDNYDFLRDLEQLVFDKSI